MPAAHPSCSPRRAAACALVSLALVACALPPAPRACPMRLPMPLRPLYLASQLVGVMRAGKSVAVEEKAGSKSFKTSFTASKLLKGDPDERAVEVYRPALGADAPEFKEGETALLFLKRRDEGDGYHVTDYSYGVKKLADDKLKVYVARIEELAVIARGKLLDPAQIAEWLVRCAEEPATRWEGAVELASGVSLDLYSEEDEPADGEAGEAARDAAAVQPASPAPVAPASPESAAPASPESAAPVSPESAAPASPAAAGAGVNTTVLASAADSAAPQQPGLTVLELLTPDRLPQQDYVSALTPAQKERLAAALYAAEEIDQGALELMTLVSAWDDPRLAPFILKHLQRMADKPHYDAAILMSLAARALGDKALIKFADDYSEEAVYDDLYLEEEEEEEAESAEAKKERDEQRAAAADALSARSSKVYHFLVLAQQPQKQRKQQARRR